MESWKPLLEKALAKEYPGTAIKWNGDDPMLIVPDELEAKENEIIEYVTALWEAWGGEMKLADVK